MKKFLVLYRMDMAKMREMMANTSPEEAKKGMDEWRAWMEENKAHFADGGAPLGKNTHIAQDGVSQVSNDIGGYAIMQGESADDVVKVMQSSPHMKMPGTTTDIMELGSM